MKCVHKIMVVNQKWPAGDSKTIELLREGMRHQGAGVR